MDDLILKIEGVSKSFPGVKALDNIRLEVKRNEIHALIGENGAGKSTLIKILGGIWQADCGRIFVDGKEAVISDVQAARRLGISVIHQELSLANNMTVAENVYMGKFPLKNGLVDEERMERETSGLLSLIGMEELDPSKRVSKLSTAQKQMVEICRSLSENAKILVMDEPTSSLAAAEVERLFKIMRTLQNKGVTIIFISHKLNEIFTICKRITVMRDGKYIGMKPVKEITYEELINMMVGRDIQDVYPPHETEIGDIFFEANHIHSDKIEDASFCLRKGEVLGFYGLMGAGRSELMQALLGIDKSTKGDIFLNHEKITINTPTEAVRQGIVLAPEDRKQQGLILRQTVDFNITITILDRIIKGIRLNKQINNETVSNIAKRLKIKTPSYESKVINLSGGNQQKVVLAKWLVTAPKILILDEPTRGIDLSQGSVIGFTSCFCAFMISGIGMPFWAGILCALAVGTLFGIFNGALLSHTKLPPFIVTLATQFIGRGGCYVITRGNMINIDAEFGELGNGYLFGVIPLPVVYLMFFFVVMFMLLEKSKFGRNVYAIGGNAEAARFTGINIKSAIWIIYGISGFLAAVCGIISCSRITTGQPTTGTAMEFDAVIACYLGGVSYLGGEGRISSTLLGAIVLGVLANAMSMLQIPWYVQNITKGTIILVAVFFDIWRKEKENSKK